MQVIIMRGLPGSGKSREAEWHKGQDPNGTLICSADHYHMVNGVYQFVQENAARAHDACFNKFVRAVLPLDPQAPWPNTVIVDNTNTSLWELAPYYRLAELYAGRDHVEIVRCQCSFEVACRRNTHKVPYARMWAMHQNLLSERLPEHWKETIVLTDEVAG